MEGYIGSFGGEVNERFPSLTEGSISRLRRVIKQLLLQFPRIGLKTLKLLTKIRLFCDAACYAF